MSERCVYADGGVALDLCARRKDAACLHAGLHGWRGSAAHSPNICGYIPRLMYASTMDTLGAGRFPRRDPANLCAARLYVCAY
jgi:hypothetical protein